MRFPLLTALLLTLVVSPALAAEAPWQGWRPESIASPDAHGRFAFGPATGTTPAGWPVVGWVDDDGSVEVSVRDPDGRWRTAVIGSSPVNRIYPGHGSYLDGMGPFLTHDASGVVIVGWGACAPGATICQAVRPPQAWAAARLEPDGTWAAVTGFAPADPRPSLQPLPPEASPSDPAHPRLNWRAWSNEHGDAIAFASLQVDLAATASLRPAGGIWGPFAMLRRAQCKGRSKFHLPYPSIDATGSGADFGLCAIDTGTPETLHDGPVTAFLVPVGGAAIARTLPIPASRHVVVTTAAFAQGGLIVAAGDAEVEAFDWSHEGALTGPSTHFPCTGTTWFPCFVTLTVDTDGRAALSMGTYLGGSDSIALRDATGAWTDAYPIGMHPDVTILNGGAPAFLALGGGVGLSRGPSAGGFSMVALGADSAPPSVEKLPYFRYSIERVGVPLHLSSRGTWRGAPVPALSVRWLRCRAACRAIPGATARSYRPRTADIGWRIAVEVTATNAYGTAHGRTIDLQMPKCVRRPKVCSTAQVVVPAPRA
jgi:hypothetical protein